MCTSLPLIRNLIGQVKVIRSREILKILPIFGHKGSLTDNKNNAKQHVQPKNNLFIFGVVNVSLLILLR